MEPQTLFRFGLITITMTVFSIVLSGCFLWTRWFIASRVLSEKLAPNFSDDLSTNLVTHRDQEKPCWTILEFFLAFGLMLVSSVVLTRQLLPPSIENAQKQASSSTQLEPTAISPTEQNDANTPPDLTVSAPEKTGNTQEKAARTKPKTPLRVQVSVHFFASAISLILTLLYLRSVHGANLHRLGMVPSLGDLRSGIIASAWIFAPVLLVNFVVSQLVKYEHSVTDMLAQGNNVLTFAFLMLSAAVLTPIAEEFQFRLLLQGGLQRVADGADLDDSPTWVPKSFWPILVTSFVFACLHLGQGAAPIPLFFLSIGLGILYQSTGRLTPAIIVHMLLNGATLCMEFCRMNAGL